MVSEWRVGVSDVGILVSRIFDSTRDSALVVVSPASDTNRPRIDSKLLAQHLAPGTELAVLDSMTASERLSDTVDPQFQVYGGGIRVILAGRPGPTIGDGTGYSGSIRETTPTVPALK